jgi:hypothetical protein
VGNLWWHRISAALSLAFAVLSNDKLEVGLTVQQLGYFAVAT